MKNLKIFSFGAVLTSSMSFCADPSETSNIDVDYSGVAEMYQDVYDINDIIIDYILENSPSYSTEEQLNYHPSTESELHGAWNTRVGRTEFLEGDLRHVDLQEVELPKLNVGFPFDYPQIGNSDLFKLWENISEQQKQLLKMMMQNKVDPIKQDSSLWAQEMIEEENLLERNRFKPVYDELHKKVSVLKDAKDISIDHAESLLQAWLLETKEDNQKELEEEIDKFYDRFIASSTS